MAAPYDNTTSRALRKLEETSQQHEGDIVTDLGVDRLILWIGTYLLTALAVIVKVADAITGLNLLCFPINDSTNPSNSFIQYSSNYCWETKRDLAINGSCSRFNKDGANFLPEPYYFKMMLLGLPYCLLGQGIIYAAIWASWHVVYGSRLKGHLKFIQLFLEETFQQLKYIDEGFYATFPYDRNCINFNGFKKYVNILNKEKKILTERHQIWRVEHPIVQSDFNRYKEGAGNAEGQVTQDPNIQAAGVSGAETDSQRNEDADLESTSCGGFRSFICGSNMKDRHFFSMLCSENFSSLYHLPYILSVFKLSGGDGEVPNDRIPGNFPIHAAVLRLWCHDKNMDNNIMLTWYLMKHIVTGILTALMLLAMFILYFHFLHGALYSTGNFRCELLFEDGCMLCTAKGKTEIFVVLFINMATTALIMMISIITVIVVRTSHNRMMSCFFKQIKDATSIALDIANNEKKTRKQKYA